MPRSKGTGKQGRPAIKIDWDLVDKLLFIQCTEQEICGILGVDIDTLVRRCKSEKKMVFAEYALAKKSGGKMSLRRKMWERATTDGSDTMLIWLSKNELKYTDRTEAQISGDLNVRASVAVSFGVLKSSMEAPDATT